MSQMLESARSKKTINRKVVLALALAALLSAWVAKLVSDLAFS